MLRLLYVGERTALNAPPAMSGSILPYLLRRTFQHRPLMKEAGTVDKGETAEYLSRHRDNFDVAILETPAWCSQTWPCYWQATSRWVRWVIDLTPSMDEITASFRRDLRTGDLSKIARRHFTCQTTCDNGDLEMFYKEMYLPTATSHPSDIAIIEPLVAMLPVLRAGHLLFALEGNQHIAGGILSPMDDTLRCRWLGLKNGLAKYRQCGGIAALCWFSILFGKTNGYNKLDLGVTRPILNDGLYRFKRKWGGSVISTDECGPDLRFVFNRLNPAVHGFFSTNPTVFRQRDALWGLASIPDNDMRGEARKARWIDRYSAPGIRGLVLLSQSGTSELSMNGEAVAVHPLNCSQGIHAAIELVSR